MGGDHKCSVCQATFTRPQHVARHMRSRRYPSQIGAPPFWTTLSTHPHALTYFSFSVDTGDRPYKCQFCGDQFARRCDYSPSFPASGSSSPHSDLLSRHVNKCHPNERQPQLAGSTRRKGSASASRATTSKQSCDQCVQASLPCDGSNPCGLFSAHRAVVWFDHL